MTFRRLILMMGFLAVVAGCQHQRPRPAAQPVLPGGVGPVPFPGSTSHFVPAQPLAPAPVTSVPVTVPVAPIKPGFPPAGNTPNGDRPAEVELGAPRAAPAEEGDSPAPPRPAVPHPSAPAKKEPEPKDETDSPFPAGIPQFAQVKKGVATGRRPMLDGLDWLRKAGYRTVVFVRRPAEDDTTDRKQVEKRGLKFVSLAISAETITPELVTAFREAVSSEKNLPVFVYDRDGLLAGALWYLYFRTAEDLDHDAALLRAQVLGFRTDGTDVEREMWLAVQNYLSRHGE